MEDDYPSPQEEDEGPTFSSDELHRDTHTYPSPDLTSDLIESAERRYHKTVAALQIAHHRAVQKLLDTVLAQVREHCQKTGCDKKAAVAAGNQYLRKQRGELERVRDAAIERERENLQQQVTRIQQWIELQQPSSHL